MQKLGRLLAVTEFWWKLVLFVVITEFRWNLVVVVFITGKLYRSSSFFVAMVIIVKFVCHGYYRKI